ncbi:hypothetical protein Dsin_023420 [Dipteronia sinensis]|uniref:Uncharacterized protein n=1 Tax=Dipteronia sinensis TaxID=43782 RepID=A0AAE0E0N5_9ROSI|nr:hypothetical protein Dsin_023420 [Dipteronia sinensis]
MAELMNALVDQCQRMDLVSFEYVYRMHMVFIGLLEFRDGCLLHLQQGRLVYHFQKMHPNYKKIPCYLCSDFFETEIELNIRKRDVHVQWHATAADEAAAAEPEPELPVEGCGWHGGEFQFAFP